MRATAALLLSLAAAVPARAAAPPLVQPAMAMTRLPAAQDAYARMTIPVTIDGHGPFHFVIDTGADRSVVSTRVAAELGLKPGRPVRLHHTAGEAMVDTVVLDSLSFGGRTLHGLEAPALQTADLGTDGMLGIDALADQQVVMDFADGSFSTRPAHRTLRQDGVIVVYGRSRFGQLVLLDGRADNQRVFVILDSGAQNSLGNRALQALLSSQADQARPPGNDVISVMGGHTPARTNDIQQIDLGGLALHDVPIAYADLDTFRQFGLQQRPAMLLGMDVLHLFRKVTVDFQNREAAFTP